MVGLIAAVLIVIALIGVTVWLMLGRGAFGPDERTDDERFFPGDW